MASPIHIVDCGCGSADLTFAVYHYLNHILGHPAVGVGIDVKADLMAE
jgi:ubiquinone/menaquinone biosynthesis C-methylase UbiE